MLLAISRQVVNLAGKQFDVVCVAVNLNDVDSLFLDAYGIDGVDGDEVFSGGIDRIGADFFAGCVDNILDGRRCRRLNGRRRRSSRAPSARRN